MQQRLGNNPPILCPHCDNDLMHEGLDRHKLIDAEIITCTECCHLLTILDRRSGS